MDTVRGYLMMLLVEKHKLKRNNDRPGLVGEEYLERVASAISGAWRALQEKRDRLVQQRANGKSL
jgi:hypothetical protein